MVVGEVFQAEGDVVEACVVGGLPQETHVDAQDGVGVLGGVVSEGEEGVDGQEVAPQGLASLECLVDLFEVALACLGGAAGGASLHGGVGLGDLEALLPEEVAGVLHQGEELGFGEFPEGGVRVGQGLEIHGLVALCLHAEDAVRVVFRGGVGVVDDADEHGAGLGLGVRPVWGV